MEWILTTAPPGSASISTPRPGARGWEDGISQRGGSRVPGQPAGPFCLRREREMEKAGRRLASAAPPQCWFRRPESGARSVLVLPLPIAQPPVRRPSSERPHACVPQAGYPLPTEPKLRAGTQNTQVTGFRVP